MALNKFNFINNLISRFNYYIQGEQAQQVLYDVYSRVLSKKIDYDKLWNLFCNEYKDKTPPTGVQLKEFSKRCFLESEISKSSNWQQVRVYNPITKVVSCKDCFPKGTSIEQMLATYENKFKCKGFEILEVY